MIAPNTKVRIKDVSRYNGMTGVVSEKRDGLSDGSCWVIMDAIPKDTDHFISNARWFYEDELEIIEPEFKELWV